MSDNIFNDIESILSKVYKNKKTKEKYVNDKQIERLLLGDYSEAYKNALEGNFIFRGSRKVEGDVFIRKPGTRISQNTINIYTRLLSEILPSWSEYPKRNNSFICSTSPNRASEYGRLLVVFPKNGAKISVCSDLDIFWSFKLADLNIGDMDDFNRAFLYIIAFLECAYKMKKIKENDKMLRAINIHKHKFANKIQQLFYSGTSKKILSLFSDAETVIRTMIGKTISMNDVIDQLGHRNETFIKKLFSSVQAGTSIVLTLDSWLNPKRNNFKLIDVSDYSLGSESLELWTDSECLMFDADFIYNSYSKMLKNLSISLSETIDQ